MPTRSALAAFAVTLAIVAWPVDASVSTLGTAPASAAPSPGSDQSAGDAVGPLASPLVSPCAPPPGIACYSPAQIEQAYDLPPLYARGDTGRGRTIVVVDPFGSPTIGSDLKTFDRTFNLPPPPSLRVLQPVGAVPPFNIHNRLMTDKAGETSLDVEWAHAMAPGAAILLVETPTAETATGGGFTQLMAAENYVVSHNLGDVISQSFGLPEPDFPSASYLLGLRYAFVNAARHHITVLAASQDWGVSGPTPSGAYYHRRVVNWPASDPLVTGVGGTHLDLNSLGSRVSPDTAWNDTESVAVTKEFGTVPPLPFATGGGVSSIFSRPSYQNGVQGTVGDARGVPDVSMSASLSAGVAVYESYTGGAGKWFASGGTSAATPEFSGIVAIADQYAGTRLGLINPELYLLSETNAPGIVDVTKGNNTVSFVEGGKVYTVPGYQAQKGYNLATGVGTIDAARLVPELASLR